MSETTQETELNTLVTMLASWLRQERYGARLNAGVVQDVRARIRVLRMEVTMNAKFAQQDRRAARAA